MLPFVDPSAVSKLFVSPHNDDAVLFGAFTLQRENPTVLTVFDSYVQVERGHPQCDAMSRRAEDRAAIAVELGCAVEFGGIRDDESLDVLAPAIFDCLQRWAAATDIWLPAVEENGHDHHNLVGEIGLRVFANRRIHRYLTYTRTGGKSTAGIPVACNGAMALKKLRALACYRTQMEIDALGCWPHFLRDQHEYYVE